MINVIMIIAVFLLLMVVRLLSRIYEIVYEVFETEVDIECELKKIKIIKHANYCYTQFKNGDISHEEMCERIKIFDEE